MTFPRCYPYAAKSFIQYEWWTPLLRLYLTFRHPMDQTVKPHHDLWICKVDAVNKPIVLSAWVDEWTLVLLMVDIVARPDHVTLEYEGPDENLKTTWEKQWEPWGPIVCVELPPVYTCRTFSTGPAQQNDVDVSGINVMFLDCSANDITIGGLIGGVSGQVLHIAKICAAAQDVTLKHIAGTGNQDLYLHAGGDETLRGEYGGWTLACLNDCWYDMSHAKHV
ncbi:hypothetical protein ES703_86358 [subsurface metagenome]